MIQKHWSKLKISLCIITTILVFSLYLYTNITGTTMNTNEIITLPVSGISMPYWLLISIGYILLPGFSTLIMYEILDKIEENYIY